MDQIIGLFLGTAVGDAMGLPRENLSPKRSVKLFGKKIQPALLVLPNIGRFATCSDDTEHLWITADALIRSNASPQKFSRLLANNLKKWLLSFPVGAGKASLKAAFKLLIGISPAHSGIDSAGNGPAMRASIIGAYWAHEPEKLSEYLTISTRMTHTDPQAEEGAWLIAQAAALLIREQPNGTPIEIYFSNVLSSIRTESLKYSLTLARDYLLENRSLDDYLMAMDLDHKGVSGYIGHTVPAVIYAWLRYFDQYEKAIEKMILAGGDSDTTAAILGALMGISAHKDDIPKTWMAGIYNAPISLIKLSEMASAVQKNDSAAIPKISWGLQALRNVVLLMIVLLHGFRRLLPPY